MVTINLDNKIEISQDRQALEVSAKKIEVRNERSNTV